MKITRGTLIAVTVACLVLFYLGLGITSVFHSIYFWHIFNEQFYAYLLAIGVFLGIASVLLLTFLKIGTNFTKAMIFFPTLFAEICGNVFYQYIKIDIASLDYQAYLELMTPLLNFFKIMEDAEFSSYLKSMTAVIFGLWIPIVHLGVFWGLMSIIKEVDVFNESEQSDVDVNSNQDEIIKNDEPIVEDKTISLDEVIIENQKVIIPLEEKEEEILISDNKADLTKEVLLPILSEDLSNTEISDVTYENKIILKDTDSSVKKGKRTIRE